MRLLLVLFLATIAGCDARCEDFAAGGYYVNGQFVIGRPRVWYRPYVESRCSLARLHRDCVARINAYRRTIGAPALKHAARLNRCTNAKTMGEMLWTDLRGGDCAGAHSEAFACPGFYGNLGDNSCCARGFGSFGNLDKNRYDTHAKVRRQLFFCLRDMWNEKKHNDLVQTHYEIMASRNYTCVSCGFAFTAQGMVYMSQSYAEVCDQPR